MDHCATTPPYDEVIETVCEVMKRHFGNPSSLHRLGIDAERLVAKAREVIAEALHVRADELIFTSCGTECNNLAIKGVAMQYRNRGRHIITSAVEHPSVEESCRQLEAEGFRVTRLSVDSTGAVSVEELERAICNETILVSVMHVNNEMGRIQPVEQIGRLLRGHAKIFFHVDAVQSVGKLQLHPSAYGIDLLSCSAHKIRGPKGVGFLFVRNGIRLNPLLAGGGQEGGLRSGTENVPLIVGMAKALRITTDRQAETERHLYSLRLRLVERLKEIPGLRLNGSEQMTQMAPHIVNFSVPGMKAEVIVHALEEHGIFISTRSACASGEHQPSRVLLAMGLETPLALSGLRVSLARDHTERDIDFFHDKLKQVLQELVPQKPAAFHNHNGG
jgi:cysteine desulfurase